MNTCPLCNTRYPNGHTCPVCRASEKKIVWLSMREGEVHDRRLPDETKITPEERVKELELRIEGLEATLSAIMDVARDKLNE